MNSNLLIALGVALVLVIGAFWMNNQAASNQTSTVPAALSEQIPGNNSADSVQADVTLTKEGYSPKVLTIKSGTKVVWTNKSGARSTVHSSPHPQHTDFMPLNLGPFEDGQSLSLVFDKPGTYKYHNHLNATQFGQVIVE